MSKHTAGPWKFSEYGEHKYLVSQDKHHDLSRRICFDIDSPCDASLIAAAPELLEALEEASNFINTKGSDEFEVWRDERRRIYYKAIDAIAKARGEA